MTVLRLKRFRKDGVQEAGLLEIVDAEKIALAFFKRDLSSVGGDSYDAYATSAANPRDCFVRADVEKINKSMRARSAYGLWDDLMNRRLDWLVDVQASWDLVEMSDEEWQRNKCQLRIRKAIESMLTTGRNIAVITKALHLKRPRLIPICDNLVQQVLGTSVSGADEASQLIGHIRAQAQRNRCELQEIQTSLKSAAPDLERSLVRILDGVLWGCHPASWLSQDGTLSLRWIPN